MLSSRTVAAALAGVFVFGTAFTACNSDAPGDDTVSASPDGTPAAAAPARTPVFVADVVQEWPHDPTAFTQGLVWHEGRLFEGTGQEGKSSIREVELRTGRVLRRHDLEQKYFGEGIVLLGDDLYQITWTSGVAFVYDWKTFAPKRQFKYDGEGWGLTTDGTSIIMSDGSATLRYRDPATFAIQKSITVRDKGKTVPKLNELEWVKGEIWANVWESDQIARIDPATGNVTGWIDLAGILPKMDRTGNEDVLNGIAYDASGDRLFVTGKLWSKLYEIKLKQRS
ncbi:MAG: glutaminyl-peptide cyclotransferase [Gemmatimonadota bacterium]